jgi:hypothetical protein
LGNFSRKSVGWRDDCKILWTTNTCKCNLIYNK